MKMKEEIISEKHSSIGAKENCRVNSRVPILHPFLPQDYKGLVVEALVTGFKRF